MVFVVPPTTSHLRRRRARTPSSPFVILLWICVRWPETSGGPSRVPIPKASGWQSEYGSRPERRRHQATVRTYAFIEQHGERSAPSHSWQARYLQSHFWERNPLSKRILISVVAT